MTKSELEILFKTHYAAMFRLAVSLLYDADEARDVVSDVFASLLDGGLAIRTQYHEHQDKRRFGIDISWIFNATRSRYKGSYADQDERNRL